MREKERDRESRERQKRRKRCRCMTASAGEGRGIMQEKAAFFFFLGIFLYLENLVKLKVGDFQNLCSVEGQYLESAIKAKGDGKCDIRYVVLICNMRYVNAIL